MLYRRERDGAWGAIARVTPDGLRRLRYEDRDVVPGATYGYRLGLSVPAGEIFAGETEVFVPLGSRLALGAVSWDRGARSLSFGLTLPHPGSATVEVFDVGGRRWSTHRLDGLEGGTNEVHVRLPAALASGVFFARASQNDELALRRFVVVR
jgi:hypothetical protein